MGGATCPAHGPRWERRAAARVPRSHRSMISESCMRARNWLSLRISLTAPLNSRLCLWTSLLRSCSSLLLPCFLPNSSLRAGCRHPGGRSS